jgi:hypothetical protein
MDVRSVDGARPGAAAVLCPVAPALSASAAGHRRAARRVRRRRVQSDLVPALLFAHAFAWIFATVGLVVQSIAWSVGILLVRVPLAVWRYRRAV